MGDLFKVKVEDLTDGSNAFVTVECDYCHREFEIRWLDYLKSKRKLIKKDCCGNPECTSKKAQETIQEKYNVSNVREIPGINEKIATTNLERYGSENPFGSKEIMNKIKETNLSKYGVEWYTQTEESKERYRQTCLERYGVPNYSYTESFIQMMSGENSPNWKGDDVKIPRERYRECADYRNWRKVVFDRDLYTCQCCGARNGNGKYVYLEAHHINNWASCEDERYNVDNGITFCKDCHNAFHSIYGKKNNNREQVDEFIKANRDLLDEKIC